MRMTVLFNFSARKTLRYGLVSLKSIIIDILYGLRLILFQSYFKFQY